MSSVPFDTLKFAEKLQAGGFSPEQARAASAAFAEIMAGAELVTKADLKAEVATIRTDLRYLEHGMTIKLGGMLVVAAGVIVAAQRLLPLAH